MYQAPRGTADILPEDQPYWRFVEQKANEICRLYGFRRIDTPTFEDSGLFTRGVGEGTDIVEKEMYTFDDRGGNSLTLKPEGTASICRAYVEHGMQNLSQPVKLYYFSSIFRYDRPQAGRYREHHQFGCEAIGSDDVALDAEVIDTAWRFYTSLGLRGLSLSMNSIGCPECRPAYLQTLKDYYTGKVDGLCPDCKVRYEKNPLRLLDCKQDSCQQAAEEAPKSADHLCEACADHFTRLKSYLELLKIPFRVNHRMVRGLDYYTRTVFEIEPEEAAGQSSLGGGGRYDGLIEQVGGKPTPAVGFAAGIERIILNMKKQGIELPDREKPSAYIAFMGEAARDEAFKLAAHLRSAGISVFEAVGSRSLKAQLRQANTLGVRYALIIGDDEVKNASAVVREMSTGEQQTVPFNELETKLG